MPQFTFVATDRLGNQIDGTVFANDLTMASEQVLQMGYSPMRVEVAARAGVSAPVAPAPEEATPLEVSYQEETQALAPLGLNAWSETPTLLGGEDDAAWGEKKEPWERGAPIPRDEKPVVRLNAEGVVIRTPAPQNPAPLSPAAQAELAQKANPVGYSGQGRLERIPYGRDGNPQRPLGRRFLELIVYPVFAGVVIKDLAAFYRQFATLIDAGLPIYQSLCALEANTQNPKLKEVARAGQKQVEAGGRFSDVLAAYPWVFSPMQIEMIRASEEGGMLDEALLHLANYIEHELEIRRMISRETMYPKIVLFFALMILGRSGFTGGPLAIVGLVLKGDGAGYFANTIGFGGSILLAIFGAYVVFRLFLFNMPGVREGYDLFKTKIPVLGKLVRMFALARFSRSFAALYRGGFSMARSLEVAGAACGNTVVQNAVRGAARASERGGLASQELAKSGVLPGMALDMFRTGEMTGNLDQMMDKVSDYFESEAKLKSHQAALIFGVVVFLIVALLVGSSIVSFYGGMANSTMNAGGE